MCQQHALIFKCQMSDISLLSISGSKSGPSKNGYTCKDENGRNFQLTRPQSQHGAPSLARQSIKGALCGVKRIIRVLVFETTYCVDGQGPQRAENQRSFFFFFCIPFLMGLCQKEFFLCVCAILVPLHSKQFGDLFQWATFNAAYMPGLS